MMKSDEVPCRDTDPMDSSGSERTAVLPPGPMAFTIDFGGEETGSNRKLGLKDGIKHFAPPSKRTTPVAAAAPKPKSASAPAAKPLLLLDKENNITNAIKTVTAVDVKDEGSDAGTYTIDDDDQAQAEREKIESVFSVEKSEMDPREWVSQWAAASSSASSNSRAYGGGGGGSESPGSREEMSKSRRKLPATPFSDLQRQASTAETQNFLQDTISVMEAMEARIVCEDRKRTTTTTTSMTTRRTKVTEQEERKLAWERRKNYDPLRAVGGVRKTSPSPKFPPPPLNDTDTDTCSEFEQNSLTIREGNNKPLVSAAATRPNRAFALRKKLNRSTEEASVAAATGNNNNNIARGDGGRFSLRGTKTAATTTATTTRKTLLSKSMSESARSSSSLSSKEAEFQAWKRRKNYNPLAASGLGQGRKSPLVSAEKPKAAPVILSQRGASSSNGHSAAVAVIGNGQQQPMQRSASFHYPDGLSRVQHNVYSSEDESPDDYWEKSDLFEVNDDEFILPIGGKYHRSSPSSGSSRMQHPRVRSPPGGKMEALDNLVISTIFSISTKLCLNSASLIRRAQERVTNEEQHAIMDTLLYVLEDTDPPASPSKKTSRELAGTLRNLKKVEQALQVFEGSCFETEDLQSYDEDADDENK